MKTELLGKGMTSIKRMKPEFSMKSVVIFLFGFASCFFLCCLFVSEYGRSGIDFVTSSISPRFFAPLLRKYDVLESRPIRPNVYDLSVVDPDTPDIPCVNLTMMNKLQTTPICVYTAKADPVVSRIVLETGIWEPHLTHLIEKIYAKDKNLHLLDLGCNVGVFTMVALRTGRQVVCVDPKEGNLKRIKKSIQKGKFTDRAVLVQNALSDERRTVEFHQLVDNNGGSWVTDFKKDDKRAANKTYMDSVLLKDLITVIKFKRAIIKIDIQGFEYRAFRTLKHLLEHVDIPFIQMEWVMVKLGETGKLMAKLMHDLGYQCFSPAPRGPRCVGPDPVKWPYDVTWIRTNASIYSGAAEAVRIWYTL